MVFDMNDAMPAVDYRRIRAWYVLAVVVTIALGLASRHFRGALPEMLGKYPGDALWALMVFFGWGAVLPRASTARIALLTLGVCLAIEMLKLYQAPWIVGIRHSTPGHLVFGQVFAWANLIAYAVGTAVGTLIDGFFPKCGGTRVSGLAGRGGAG